MSAQNYLILENLLPNTASTALAVLAHDEKRWKLHEESFFSQNDVSWVRREFGRPPLGVATPEIAALLRTGAELIESEMNAVIGTHHTVVGHKMVVNQMVGIHNDSPELDRGRTENFRLIYYVDNNYSDDKGGHLLLFGSNNATDIIDAVRPLFNSAVVMQLSDKSYHAVSRVRSGVRYSLVVSYWGYPLLFTAPGESERVRRCLRRIIELGLEDVGHSGSTFADHLFHTFRLLHGWGLDIDVCLAGLMHSLLGRKPTKVASSRLERSELQDLVGGKALDLVELLEKQSGLVPTPTLSAEMVVGLQVVELANLLEQSQTLADVEEVAEHVSRISVASDLRSRICADIRKVRTALVPEGIKSTTRH